MAITAYGATRNHRCGAKIQTHARTTPDATLVRRDSQKMPAPLCARISPVAPASVLRNMDPEVRVMECEEGLLTVEAAFSHPIWYRCGIL